MAGKRVRDKAGGWPAVRKTAEGPQQPCAGTTMAGTPCKNTSRPGKTHCLKHLTDAERDPVTERRCTGHGQFTGKPCVNAPMKGQLVCRRHGGMAAQSRNAAALWEANIAAQKVLSTMGAIVPVANALAALQALAGEVIAWKDACRSRLAKLEEADWRFTSQLEIEQARTEVLLFERALDRAVETLTKLSRVQVDERLALIEEAKANMIMDAFGRALAKAGVTSDAQQQAAWGEFGRRLKVVPAAIVA